MKTYSTPDGQPDSIKEAVNISKQADGALPRKTQFQSRYEVSRALDEGLENLSAEMQHFLKENAKDDERVTNLLLALPSSDSSTSEEILKRITQSKLDGAAIASEGLQEGENTRNALLKKLSKTKQDKLTGEQVDMYAPTILGGTRPGMSLIDASSTLSDALKKKVVEYLHTKPFERNIKSRGVKLAYNITEWAATQDPKTLPLILQGANVQERVAVALVELNREFTTLQNINFNNLSPVAINGILGEGITNRQRAKIFKNPRKITKIVGKNETARIKVRISGEDKPQEFYGTGAELADQLENACKLSHGKVIQVRVKRDASVEKAMTESESGVIFKNKEDTLEVKSSKTSYVSAARKKSTKNKNYDELDTFKLKTPMRQMGFDFAVRNETKEYLIDSSEPDYEDLTKSFQTITF
ncbi:MAG: hypothetical protein O2904_04960 [bacterium]|nr:hypothetical protein [bacterium]